ncbi:hypothetical protein ACOMHN_040251 [Nucella lapillus]
MDTDDTGLKSKRCHLCKQHYDETEEDHKKTQTHKTVLAQSLKARLDQVVLVKLIHGSVLDVLKVPQRYRGYQMFLASKLFLLTADVVAKTVGSRADQFFWPTGFATDIDVDRVDRAVRKYHKDCRRIRTSLPAADVQADFPSFPTDSHILSDISSDVPPDFLSFPKASDMCTDPPSLPNASSVCSHPPRCAPVSECFHGVTECVSTGDWLQPAATHRSTASLMTTDCPDTSHPPTIRESVHNTDTHTTPECVHTLDPHTTPHSQTPATPHTSTQSPHATNNPKKRKPSESLEALWKRVRKTPRHSDTLIWANSCTSNFLKELEAARCRAFRMLVETFAVNDSVEAFVSCVEKESGKLSSPREFIFMSFITSYLDHVVYSGRPEERLKNLHAAHGQSFWVKTASLLQMSQYDDHLYQCLDSGRLRELRVWVSHLDVFLSDCLLSEVRRIVEVSVKASQSFFGDWGDLCRHLDGIDPGDDPALSNDSDSSVDS